MEEEWDNSKNGQVHQQGGYLISMLKESTEMEGAARSKEASES